MRTRGVGGILPELCTVASLLGLITALPSGSSSSLTSPMISLSLVSFLNCSVL